MQAHRQPVTALLVCFSLVIPASPVQAAEGQPGNPTWTEEYRFYCSQLSNTCLEWSAVNQPTNNIGYGCAGLYLFHNQNKVNACASW